MKLSPISEMTPLLIYYKSLTVKQRVFVASVDFNVQTRDAAPDDFRRTDLRCASK